MEIDSIRRKAELAEPGQSALEFASDPLGKQLEVSVRDWVAVFCFERIEPGVGIKVIVVNK